MNDTENDRHLHLIGICEQKLVVGSMPRGIETKRICVPVGDRRDRIVAVLLWPYPSRVEEMKRLRKNVVVQESGVHREYAHEQDDIPAATVE